MGAIKDPIFINDYLSFDAEYGCFILSDKALEILYRQKQVICSYSGADEWGHNFFCELIDLYSGKSKYNYSLDSIVHKDQIDRMWSSGHKDEIINWVKRNKDYVWFMKAASAFADIINDLPEY